MFEQIHKLEEGRCTSVSHKDKAGRRSAPTTDNDDDFELARELILASRRMTVDDYNKLFCKSGKALPVKYSITGSGF